jgi:choline dehydrogenase-like flavoprotein
VPVLGRLGFDADCLRRRGLTNGSVTLFPRLRSRRGSWRRLAGRLGLGRGSVAPSGAGWSRQDPGRAELQGVQLLLNLEQAPQRDNAVRLSPPAEAGRDGPVRLEWRWRPEDQQRLEGLRRIVTEAFAASGLGRVERTHDRPPDPNAHHHAGTTRMSADPAEGVVDPDGRMHGLENVYCAGASVFPGAGFANPTLTIVALALRLAAHLAR